MVKRRSPASIDVLRRRLEHRKAFLELIQGLYGIADRSTVQDGEAGADAP
jgi:hypothetical protein